MTALTRLFVVLLAALGLHSDASGAPHSAAVTSIRIHSAAGVAVTVTKPADVATIVRWFDGLPQFVARPCPNPVHVPPTVTLVFDGPGSARTTAVDRRPGTCSGEITHGRGKALADDGFIARVSTLVGLTFDPNRRTALNEAEAKRDVIRLLDHVRMPPGSRLVGKSRSRRYADAHRGWKVHMYFEDVFTFVQAHRQRGSSVDGTGAGSLWGVVNERDLFLTFPSIPHRILSREIDFHFSELPGGWTRVTADAGEEWVVARSPNEKVPDGVRSIVIHGWKSSPGPGLRVMTKPFARKLARRFTRPKEVARIVHWIDSLPVTGRGLNSWCTILVTYPAPAPVTIDFLGADGTKLASATVTTDCGSQIVDFSVRGHEETPLGGGTFLDRVEHLPH